MHRIPQWEPPLPRDSLSPRRNPNYPPAGRRRLLIAMDGQLRVLQKVSQRFRGFAFQFVTE